MSGEPTARGDSDFRFSPRSNRAADIHWRPWGEPAFAEARRLGRPILLSLSAVWCHWCHVMDETSYSDTRVIAAVNEHFVPVRVDNDRHPDVNRRYNMGGWPTTAFLAPAGDIITGATYLPPDQMVEALARVKGFFDANRAALLALGATEGAHAADDEAALAGAGAVLKRSKPGTAPAAPGTAPDDAFAGEPSAAGDVPAQIAQAIVQAYDPLHGGIGTEPKFPQPDAFAFLHGFAGLRPEAPEAARIPEVLAKTLSGMADGGMYDHVAGGFFRYATRRDWSVPHFEKMLEDNARLAALYLDAATMGVGAAGAGDGAAADEAAEAGDESEAAQAAEARRRAAEDVISYLLAALWRGDPPAFAGSQDADEVYYDLEAEARAQLPQPFIDPTVYVDWNALAARALLRAAPLFDRPELAERATELLGHLLAHARRNGAMVHYLTPEGEPGDGAPLLVDQAAVAAALLDAYEVTAERRWLERAQELAGWARAHLRAPDGRLYDRLAAPGTSPGLLARPVPALEENALMADVLLRLSAYTGDERHRGAACEILVSWAPQYAKYGVGAGPYGLALLRYLERPDHIAVVGGRGEAQARRLHAAALTTPRPLRTTQLLDPADAADAERIAAAGFGDAAAPSAYVCRGTTCLAPVTDPAALAAPR